MVIAIKMVDEWWRRWKCRCARRKVQGASMQWVPSASFHRSKAGSADHPDDEDDPNHINDDKVIIMISLKSKSNGYHNFDDDGVTVSYACMRVKHDAEKDGFKMIDLIFAGKGCEVWAVLVTHKSLPGICECLSETYSAPVSTSQSTCIKTIWKRKIKWLFSCPATYSSYMSSNIRGANCKFCLAFQGDDLLWPSLVSNICHPSMQQSYASKYAQRTCVKMNQGIVRQG